MSKPLPLVHLFLGVPGSGKSYFARQLAERTGAVRINSDAMRLAIFGSREAISDVYHSENRQNVNTYVFRAMDYVTEQILEKAVSVVYDAHTNKREDRAAIETIAKRHGAQTIVISVQTPLEVAMRRGQEREPLADQRQLTEEEMREVTERHLRDTDELVHELVIIIDGQAPFEQQYESYKKQLNELING